MTKESNTYTVPAVEKAITILNYLKNNQKMTQTQISKSLDLPKSSVFRILKTLENYSYVEENDNGLYSLGSGMLDLINNSENNLDLVEIAIPYMKKLTNITGKTSKLANLQNNKATVIYRVNSDKEMGITTDIGSQFPLHAGAASKLLLAHISEVERNNIISDSLEKYTPNTITDPSLLEKKLEEIKKKGYAIDNEEYIEGIRAIACPVSNHNSEVIAAVSIPFLVTNSYEEKQKKLLNHLKRCANNISKSLGYNL